MRLRCLPTHDYAAAERARLAKVAYEERVCGSWQQGGFSCASCVHFSRAAGGACREPTVRAPVRANGCCCRWRGESRFQAGEGAALRGAATADDTGWRPEGLHAWTLVRDGYRASTHPHSFSATHRWTVRRADRQRVIGNGFEPTFAAAKAAAEAFIRREVRWRR